MACRSACFSKWSLPSFEKLKDNVVDIVLEASQHAERDYLRLCYFILASQSSTVRCLNLWPYDKTRVIG